MIPTFARSLEQYGPRPALCGADGAALNYAELAARADAFAARLPAGKILLALEAASEPEMVAAWLGALRAGHAVALLPADDPAAMAQAERRFGAQCVYARGPGGWELRAGAAPEARPHPDLAALMLTSGSTGAGKGVRLSGAALQANAAQIATALDLRPEDRAALVLPLHYSYGLSVLNSQLAIGGSVWLHPDSVRAPGFAAGMRAAGCTVFSGVPHSYRLLAQGGDLPPLRLMTVAGGRMEPTEVRRWAARQAATGGDFAVMYGQTEAVARMAVLPPDLALAHPDAIGRPVAGGAFSLRDARGHEITAAGEVGELVYRGPNVMMGYAENAADLARGAELAELATGDLAARDAAGLWYIRGRKARFSKIGGVRLGHDALEAALAAKGITAAVTGDDRGVTVWHEAGPEVEALARSASGLGRRHMRCVALPSLPRLRNGKTDYAALRDRATLPDQGLIQALRDIFHPHPLGPQDTFEGLGGDSLRHVEMLLALEQHLGRVPQGWERLPLLSLAAPGAAVPVRAGLGSDVVLRALAILAVVVQHQTGWPVWGGAAAMVLLMGYSLGRFGRAALVAGDWRRVFRPAAQVLGAYYAVIAVYALASGQVPWVSVLLIGNFALTVPETGLMLPYLYWFVEAWTQMMLVIAAVFCLPATRRMAAARPFALGLIFLAATEALRLAAPPLMHLGGRQIFALPWVFWLCALGWCIATATTRAERAVVSVLSLAAMMLAVAAGGLWWGAWLKYGALGAAALLLVWAPVLRLPAGLGRGAVWLAQGAFFVYLTHRWVPEVILPHLAPGIDWRHGGWPVDLIAIMGGVALGLAVAAGQRGLRRLGARLASTRAGRHSPATTL